MSFSSEYSTGPSRQAIEDLSGPVVLEFGNAWCGHCRRAEPLIRQAFMDHDEVTHIRVADSSGARLGRSFRVTLWPTLVFIRDGKEVQRLVRPTNPEEIRQALARIDSEKSP